MFSRIVTSAVFAGAGAGFLAAVVQLIFVQPLLLHAELYESGQLVHFGAQAVSALQPLPGIEFVRDGLSILFMMLLYSGYGLILVALMVLAQRGGHRVGGRAGILWGVAGFVAVQLAPAFSLPPEVPGGAAGDVTARQIWWIATVISATLALWLIGFGKSWIGWGTAVVLLLAPHIIGAPQPDSFSGTAPPELAAEFAARALGSGLAAWVLLGCLCGWFWSRAETDGRPASAP